MMLFAGAPILLIKGINSINRVLDIKKKGLASAGPFFCLDDSTGLLRRRLPAAPRSDGGFYQVAVNSLSGFR
jgi:hypothetical protein